MAFLSEVVLQAKIAKRAAERLEATRENFDNVEVWCSIQSILVAAGNVSKIFWPPDKKYKARGERLRKMLNINDNDIISNRKFRNDFFEHYDARIEEWYNDRKSAVYIDLAMNPSLSGRSNAHRGYNSFNNTLEFRGKILDLKEVLKSLEEIRNKCRGYVLDYP